MVGARLANLGRGRQPANAQIKAFTQDDAASMLNVSRTTIQSAKQVIDTNTPELIAAVEQGQITVSIAEPLRRSMSEVCPRPLLRGRPSPAGA
jgi:hypothetical protein